jgi:ankyrin repeat protein
MQERTPKEIFVDTCAFGSIAKMHALAAGGADPAVLDRAGNSGLHAAAILSRLDMVEALLKLGVPPDLKNDTGHTALMQLAVKIRMLPSHDHRRELDMMSFLVDRGASLDCDNNGTTVRDYMDGRSLRALQWRLDGQPRWLGGRPGRRSPKPGEKAVSLAVMREL